MLKEAKSKKYFTRIKTQLYRNILSLKDCLIINLSVHESTDQQFCKYKIYLQFKLSPSQVNQFLKKKIHNVRHEILT